MGNSESMLEARNLAKTFNPQTANEVRALNGVDLAVEEGSWVVVVGTNGSGKSSLLNAIAGAFFVDAGRISLAGQDVTSSPEHERAKFIGRVFQNPFSGTAANMSIAENFALAARRGMRRGLAWALGSDLKQALKERVRRLNLGMEDRLGNTMAVYPAGSDRRLPCSWPPG